MKFFFRYKKSDFFLVFSFVTAFLCLCCAFVCKENANSYNADAKRYGYQNEIEIRVSHTGLFSLTGLLEGTEGVAYIADWPVSLSDETVLCTARIICHVADGEEIKLALGNRSVLKDILTSQQAIVGAETMKMCYITSDRTYIDGEEYFIVGVMGSEKSEYDHYGVILWLEALGDITRERVENADELTIRVGSDSVNGDAMFRCIRDNLKEKNLPCSVQLVNIATPDMDEDNTTKAGFYVLLYAFAMVNCIVSMELWLYERSNELAIRLTLGANRVRLFIHCFTEAVKLAFFSLIVSGVLVLIYSLTFKKNVKATFSIMDILFFAGAVLLTVLVSILLKISSVVKSDTPIEAMKAGGEL